MSAEVHDVLVKAQALITDPERWTRFAYAKTVADVEVRPTSPAACSWCPVGALAKAAGSWPALPAALPGYHVLLRLVSHRTVSEFNDAPLTTHADVLALFDRAIEATKP